MISKKVDYRKRESRNTFFGLPVLPLAIFLVLIIVLLILPSNFYNTGTTSTIQSPAHVTQTQVQQSPVTGLVTTGINLNKTLYKANDPMTGTFNLKFKRGDLIPQLSDVEFKIIAGPSPTECNDYYVCEDNESIRWQFYNSSLGDCQDVNASWQETGGGPWELCSPQEDYTTYSCLGSKIKAKCCPTNGAGYFYANLDCASGECWDICPGTVVSNITLKLPGAVALSTTPNSGNFTEGKFNNVDGDDPPGSGPGYAACFVPNINQSKGITGQAVSGITCTDSDNDYINNPDIYTRGTCVSGSTTITDTCVLSPQQPTTSSLYSDVAEADCGASGCTTQTIHCPSGQCANGACIPSQPPQLSDLIVKDIYIYTITPIPGQPIGVVTGLAASQPPQIPPQPTPTSRLYAKIYNIGNAQVPNSFTVMACWTDEIPRIPPQPIQPPQQTTYAVSSPSLPPGCFAKYDVIVPIRSPIQPSPIQTQLFTGFAARQPIELPPLQSWTIDFGSWNVQGRSVTVFVDFYAKVKESNESNNIMTKSFGGPQPFCIKDDGGSIFVKGICTDNSPLPYLKQDYCLDNYTVNEWTCPPSVINPMCEVNPIKCPSGYTCSDGACRQPPTPECNDTDGGRNYRVKGTCTDAFGSFTDNCLVMPPSPAKLIEYYCSGNTPVTNSTIPGMCSSCGTPYCVFNNPNKANGWYALCNGVETFIKSVDSCDNREKPICIGEDWMNPSRCVSENPDCTYGCENGACRASNYTCAGWDNTYLIDLTKTGLKVPSSNGNYYFTISLTYTTLPPPPIQKTNMTSASALFSVTGSHNGGGGGGGGDTHYGCRNRECTKISGSGNDQCDNSAECTTQCNENWLCSEWSDCVNSQRTRTCTDQNSCGTYYTRPSLVETCIPGCTPIWQCSDWSYCKAGEQQTQVCEDLNNCNPGNSSYMQTRDCCIEDWNCQWGMCISSKQTKTCVDRNGCDTNFTKPVEETKSCQGLGLTWWMWLIIVVVLVVVILAILFATKVLPWPFKGKGMKAAESITGKAESYPELTSYIKNAQAAGETRDEIKKKLIDAGWPDDVVRNALK